MSRKRILGAVPVNHVSPMDGLWLELEKRHDVLLWGEWRPGYERGRPLRELEREMGGCDLVLLGDPARGNSEFWIAEGMQAPIISIHNDTQRMFGHRKVWLDKIRPQVILLRAKDHIAKFRHEFRRAHVAWLPFGFDPQVFHDYGEGKDCDVAMFGVMDGDRYPTRHKAREVLMAMRGIEFRDHTSDRRDWPTGVTYARRVSRAKVAIATGGAPGFVVQKFYEIPAVGTALLAAEVTNGLRDLFAVGKHLVTFSPDCSDLEQRVRELLDGKWSSVAEAGMRHVHAHHTNAQRADALERMLGWRN